MMKVEKLNQTPARDSAEQERAIAFAVIESGDGIPSDREDSEKIIKIIEQAAEDGLLKAQMWLGRYYLEMAGSSDDKLYYLAYTWFNKAAEQGNEEANKLIKVCQLKSLAAGSIRAKQEIESGIPDRVQKGLEMLTQVSNAGWSPATLELALYYSDPDCSNGAVKERDLDKAKECLEKVIRRGGMFGDTAMDMLKELEAEEKENINARGKEEHND